MTDQAIPTDEDRRFARDWAEHIISTPDTSLPMEAAAARVILHDIPAPPPKRPTLADMTYEERRECQWMQCDVTGFHGEWILVAPSDWDGDAVLLDREGDVYYEHHASVTPRPDLPRLTWPGEQQPAPAPALPEGWRLADHKDHGRVVVTNTTPDSNGHVPFVLPLEDTLGHDWRFCDLAELTYIDTGLEVADAVD